jgi:DsbC/DsbD-like thiol-disulfide interchange protein
MLFALRKRRARTLMATGCGALLALASITAARLFAADSAQNGSTSNSVVVKAEDVTTKITISDARGYSGHRLGVSADFEVGPGWHIYGAPLPPEYTVTQVKFAGDLVESQSVNFPPPTPLKFEALGQTFPVYHGSFKAVGKILLKRQLKPGDYQLTGTVEFQECNDTECKIPQSAPFAIPLKISPMVPAAPQA